MQWLKFWWVDGDVGKDEQVMVLLIANHIFRIFVFYCPLCWNFTIMRLAELMCKWLVMAWNGFCLFFIYFFFWNLCFSYHQMTAKQFWFWSFSPACRLLKSINFDYWNHTCSHPDRYRFSTCCVAIHGFGWHDGW